MEIRKFIRSDVPRLAELGEEFALLSQKIHGFSISRSRILEFTNEVIDNDACVGFALLEEGVINGFIIGVINKIYFSNDIALQEMAWYVKPGVRGMALFLAFEKEAVRLGCHHIVAGNKPDYVDLSKTYERLGFKLLENQYVKRLS